MSNIIEQDNITEQGNPKKPEGEAGAAMLDRMNSSHYELTGWGLGFAFVKSGANVLDIGCGGGATLKRLADLVPGGHICGIDYSDISVRKSIELNSESVESHRMDIIHSSVESMPYSDDHFDLITTVESFYFWPDPENNLKEVCRVLKPGGKFLLIAEVYGTDDLSEHQKEDIEKYNLFNPTMGEYEKLFEGANFSPVKVHLKEGTSWICVEGIKR